MAGEEPLSVELPQEGDVVAGKYRVEHVVGKGGMGIVLCARHLELRKRVALKFLLPETAALPNASERFLREARAAVAIESEHVARVLDVGRLESGVPYMVMEYLSGSDLRQHLRVRAPLPVPEAVDLLLQACDAIAYAHALGVVHRDLKPANLFVTTRPDGSVHVKVLDFGLSKVALDVAGGAPEGSLTGSGVLAGSPQYAAPEQLRSLRDVDERADVWALGVVLYEMLTGERPFSGDSLIDLCMSIVTKPYPAPRTLRADLPVELEAAIGGCLEKKLSQRIVSVAELARRLAPFASPAGRARVASIERVLEGESSVPSYDEAAGSAPVPACAPSGSAPSAPRPVGLAGSPGEEPTRQAASQPEGPRSEPGATSSATLARGVWDQALRPSRKQRVTVVAALLVVGVAGAIAGSLVRFGQPVTVPAAAGSGTSLGPGPVAPPPVPAPGGGAPSASAARSALPTPAPAASSLPDAGRRGGPHGAEPGWELAPPTAVPSAAPVRPVPARRPSDPLDRWD
ncbi:MAG: protein kinase [Deltaproteobacteria bacterium]|nr:protein kinase [Deltaproteobacteria bacterium]